MNTCKTASKQMTLSGCKMNTYAKTMSGVPCPCPLVPPADTLAGQTHVRPRQAGDPSHRDPQPRSFGYPSGYTLPNHRPSHHRFSSRHPSSHRRSRHCNFIWLCSRNLDSAIQPQRLLGLDRRAISECLQRQRLEVAGQLSHPRVCRLQATTRPLVRLDRSFALRSSLPALFHSWRLSCRQAQQAQRHHRHKTFRVADHVARNLGLCVQPQ
jgi:hypothetical protein